MSKPLGTKNLDTKRSDFVPPWMVEYGIKANGPDGWLNMSKAQLRAMQRPNKPLKVQVWATGMLHAPGYNTQEATTMRGGKKVPLMPGDIIAELFTVAKQHYTAAGIKATDKEFARLKETKEDLRQVLQGLEDDGVAMRTDAKGTPLRDLSADQLKRLPSGRTRMFFWVVPRAPNPENVVSDWEDKLVALVPEEASNDDSALPSTDEGEVGKLSLPLPPISQILKALKIEGEENAKITLRISTDPTYREHIARAWGAARQIFLEVVNESLPQVGTGSPLEVGNTAGALESKQESKKGESAPAPSLYTGSSSSSTVHKQKPKPAASPIGDDDEPKPAYATPRDEVKAIYFAKTGEYPQFQFTDRLEHTLIRQGKTFADFLEVLKPHLGNDWKNPGGFLTHVAKTGFQGGTAPELAPKPKCPTCKADNQRGAILQNGVIVACPDCSTDAWREKLAAKLAPGKSKGAGS